MTALPSTTWLAVSANTPATQGPPLKSQRSNCATFPLSPLRGVVLVSPADGSSMPSTRTFSWQSVAGAEGYLIQFMDGSHNSMWLGYTRYTCIRRMSEVPSSFTYRQKLNAHTFNEEEGRVERNRIT